MEKRLSLTVIENMRTRFEKRYKYESEVATVLYSHTSVMLIIKISTFMWIFKVRFCGWLCAVYAVASYNNPGNHGHGKFTEKHFKVREKFIRN